MSEYQYYEFQAIDRRLTAAEMQKLRAYSTRAEITSTSFVNEYNWGDFRGNVDNWMERYFDAFLYFANWGTRIFKLRLSSRALDPVVVRQYCDDDGLIVREKGGHLLLTFQSELDGGEDFYDLEGGSLLSSLIPLRAELARGDHRALYLAWLAFMHDGGPEDDVIEPPVPPGLGELSGSLEALADFLRVDLDLLEVAAEASAPRAASPLQREDMAAWVAALAPTEKDEILTRLIVAPNESTSVPADLLRRFLEAREASNPTPSQSRDTRRTVGELRRAADEGAARREQATARKAAAAKARREHEAAAARALHLDRLAGQEPRLWDELERLVATKLPKCYDQAVSHLTDLRELAARDGGDRSTDFMTRLAHFRAAHARKPSLLDRLNCAGL